MRSKQQSIAPLIEYGLITVMVAIGTVLGGMALWMFVTQTVDHIITHTLVH